MTKAIRVILVILVNKVSLAALVLEDLEGSTGLLVQQAYKEKKVNVDLMVQMVSLEFKANVDLMAQTESLVCKVNKV